MVYWVIIIILALVAFLEGCALVAIFREYQKKLMFIEILVSVIKVKHNELVSVINEGSGTNEI